MRKLGAVAVATAGLFATIPFVTGATAGAAENQCWTTKPVELGVEGAWRYTFEVSWCVRGSKFTSVEPKVTHEVLDPACSWVGSLEEALTKPADDTTRTAFNLSEFSCPADISAKGVNPWVVITLHTDGTYTVDQTGTRIP
jgi:hypothetical protein